MQEGGGIRSEGIEQVAQLRSFHTVEEDPFHLTNVVGSRTTSMGAADEAPG